MAVALLKFSQGPIIGTGGWALLGTLTDGPVQIANDNNAGVGSWVIELLEAAPGSALVPGVLAAASSSTPMASFQPDVPGSYRIRLTITGLDGVVDVDIRNFSVPLPGRKKVVLPPHQKNPDPLPLLGSGEPGEKPDELNFFGQSRGWAGKGGEADATLLHKVLIDVNNLEGLPDVYAADEGDTVVLREYPFKEPIAVVYDGLTAWAIDSNWSTPVNTLAGLSSIDTEDNRARVSLDLGVADERFDGGVYDDAGGIWLATSDVPTTTAYVRKFAVASKVVGARHQVHTEVSRAVAFGATFLWHLSATQLAKVTPSSPSGPYTTLVVTDGVDLLLDTVTAHYSNAQPRVWVADAGLPGVRRASTVPAFDDTLNLASTTPKAITKSNLFVFLLAVDTAVNQAKVYRIIFDPVGLSTASNSIEAVFNVNGGGAVFDIEYDSVTNRLYVYGKNASGDGYIARVDPSSLNVEASQLIEGTLVIESSGALPRIAVFKGSVWVPIMNPGGDGALKRAVLLTLATQSTVTSFRRPEFDATGSTPSNANPQNVASTTPAAGVGGAYSRADHVHAHGSLTGGALHAVATQSVHGFMSSTDKTKLDAIAAADAAPPALGSAAVGASTDYAREDHVHAHGDLAGGSLHALAVSGGAAGFMTGVDKQSLDDAGETATVGRIVKRVTTGAIRNIMGAVGEAPTGGFYLSNPTAAANGAQQYSPAFLLTGSVWDTSAAATRSSEYALQMRSVQGNPGQPGLTFLQQYNGGGWAAAMRLHHVASNATSVLSFENHASLVTVGALLAQSGAGMSFQSTGDFEVSSDLILVNAAAGTPRLSWVNLAAMQLELAEGVSSFSFTQVQDPSAAGATWTFRAQQGRAGFVGGDFIIAGGLGGTGGSDAAGGVRVKLGVPVAGASSSFFLEREDGTKILTALETAAAVTTIYFGSASGTAAGVLRGTSVGVESASTHVSLQSAQDVMIGHAVGRDTLFREGGATVMTAHMDADGPTRLVLASGITSFSIDMPSAVALTFDADTTIFRNNAGAESNLTITPDVATLYTRIQSLRGLRFTSQGTDGISFECQAAAASVNFQSGASGSINITAGLDLSLTHGLGRDIFHKEVTTTVLTEHLDADGLSSFIFASTITGALFAISSTTAATGANIEMQAQSSTHAAGTGGLASATGGAGTTRGGHSLLTGGAGTTNGSGGLAVVRGGAKAGTGLDGNVALHTLPGVVSTWGERVTVWGVATTEPTANPANGYMFLWNTAGQLRARSNNGVQQDITWEQDDATVVTETSLRRYKSTDNGVNAATTLWTQLNAAIPQTSCVEYVARVLGRCTAGASTGQVFVVHRRVVIDSEAGTLTRDTTTDTQAEQTMLTDTANFVGSSCTWEVDGSNNVDLNFTPKDSTWTVTCWIKRYVLDP